MKLLLDEIPSAESEPSKSPLAGSDGVIWVARTKMSRRTFTKLTASAAIGVGLAALGALPTARNARASHAGTNGYQIKDLPCPNYATDHNCGNDAPYHGCGPSTVYFDACQFDAGNHKFGWHKAGQCQWILRKNDCVAGTNKDGWKWDPGRCGGCCPVVYRCHDGYKRGLQYCNILDKSVCRAVIRCGNC